MPQDLERRVKICMMVYDMQEFGGLEEYAVTLAAGLQHGGHQVSIVSAAWVSPENQYCRRLRENGVLLVQPPKWVSHPASDWPTKRKVLAGVSWGLSPLVYLLAFALLLRKRSWTQALISSRGWLHGLLLSRVIGPDRRKFLARILLNWWRWRWRPDLLHLHGYTTNLLFAIEWAHTKRMPVVYEEHQTPDAQFDWWTDFQRTINKAALVVAVSEKSAQALRTICGVTRPIVVRSPLLPDPVGPAKSGDIRPQGARPLYVTTVARLYVTKGLSYLLEAIAQVKRAHPAIEFRVYGEGPLREELLAHATRLGLDGDAIFAGAFTDREAVSKIMAQTGIFVLPSILEGQPLALVEAMAYGCPIIATRVGGIPELIDHGVNGLLCEPGNSGSLAQEIQTLIEDPALRRRLGKAARQSYEQGPFQPASVSRHFVSIYNQALHRGPLNQPGLMADVV
jgi:glycosyltransferase involved in cell wall biosynthesis